MMMAALKKEVMEARMAVVRIEAERNALQQQLEEAYRDLAEERASKEAPFALSSPMVLPTSKTPVKSSSKATSTRSPVHYPKDGKEADTAVSGPEAMAWMHSPIVHSSEATRKEWMASDVRSMRRETGDEKEGGDPVGGGGAFGGSRSGRDFLLDGGLQKKMKAIASILQGAATSLWMRQVHSPGNESGRNSGSSATGPDHRTDSPPPLDAIFSDLEEALGSMMTSWKGKKDHGAWPPSSSRCSSVHSSTTSSISTSSLSGTEEMCLFSSPSAVLDVILEALVVLSRYFARGGINDDDGDEEEKKRKRKTDAIGVMEEEEDEEEGILHVEEVSMTPKDCSRNARRGQEEREEGPTAHAVAAASPFSSPPLPPPSFLDSSAVGTSSSSPPPLPHTLSPPLPSPTASSTHSHLTNGSSAEDLQSEASTRPPSSVSDDITELYGKALYRVGQAYGGLVRDVHDLLFQRRVLLQWLQQYEGSWSSPSSLPHSSSSSSSSPLGRTFPSTHPREASPYGAVSRRTSRLLWWRVRVIAILAAGRFLKLVRTPQMLPFSSYGASWTSATPWAWCGGGERECVRVAIGPRPDFAKKGGCGGGDSEVNRNRTATTTTGMASETLSPSSSSPPLPSMVLRLRLPLSSVSSAGDEEMTAAHPSHGSSRRDGDGDSGCPPPRTHPHLSSGTVRHTVGMTATADREGTRAPSSLEDPPCMRHARSYGMLMREEVKAALAQALMEQPPRDDACPVHALAGRRRENDRTYPLWPTDIIAATTPSSASVVWCAQRRRQAEAAQVFAVLLVLQQVIEEGVGDKNPNPHHHHKKKKDDEETATWRDETPPSLLQRLGIGLSEALQRVRYPTEGPLPFERERATWMGGRREDGHHPHARGGVASAETYRTADRRLDPGASLTRFHTPLDATSTTGGDGCEEIEGCSAIFSRSALPSRRDPLSISASRGSGGVGSSSLREMVAQRMPGVLPSLSAFSTVSSTSSSFAALPFNRRSTSHLSSGVESRREERGVEDEDEEPPARRGEDKTISGTFAQEVLGVIHALDDHLSSALSRSRSSHDAIRVEDKLVGRKENET